MVHDEIVVKVYPDGGLQFLYDDNHPLLGIAGDLNITRASNVHFDNDAKLWFVHEILPDGTEFKHIPGFEKRGEAIAHEVHLLQANLQ